MKSDRNAAAFKRMKAKVANEPPAFNKAFAQFREFTEFKKDLERQSKVVSKASTISTQPNPFAEIKESIALLEGHPEVEKYKTWVNYTEELAIQIQSFKEISLQITNNTMPCINKELITIDIISCINKKATTIDFKENVCKLNEVYEQFKLHSSNIDILGADIVVQITQCYAICREKTYKIYQIFLIINNKNLISIFADFQINKNYLIFEHRLQELQDNFSIIHEHIKLFELNENHYKDLPQNGKMNFQELIQEYMELENMLNFYRQNLNKISLITLLDCLPFVTTLSKYVNEVTESEKPEKKTTVISEKPEKETTAISEKPEKKTTVISEKPEKETTVISEKPEKETTVISEKPEKKTTVISEKPEKKTTVISDQKSSFVNMINKAQNTQVSYVQLSSFKIGNREINLTINNKMSDELSFKLKNRIDKATEKGMAPQHGSEGVKVLNDQYKPLLLLEIKILGRQFGDERLLCVWDTGTNTIYGYEMTDHQGVANATNKFNENPRAYYNNVMQEHFTNKQSALQR